jgi:aspartate carbamoyltransferase catalytic subunit
MLFDKCFYGLPHVIDARQFDLPLMERIFKEAEEMRNVVARGGCNILRRKRMMSLFYEPSTRTRFSFEMAMSYLGGEVFQTENAKEFSSAVKGESLEDTIRVLCGYKPNVIVIRHSQDGAAAAALAVSGPVSIMNAGDGKEQHPTQAVLDVFTIRRELGHIDGLSIAMVGDLGASRVVNSDCYLLGKYNPEIIYFVSPEHTKVKPGIKEYLERHNIKFCEVTDLRKVASKVDVIYQTRTQTERGTALDRNDHSLGFFIVNKEILSLMKKDAIIMHPLPRNDEIAPEVDRDPRAAYFRQAENGLYVRMALLKMALVPQREHWFASLLKMLPFSFAKKSQSARIGSAA